MAKQGMKSKSADTRFSLGMNVRAKPGTTDPDFPDIPIGGWAGKIEDVETDDNPPTYLIRWNQHTLAGMHPVYRNRCERDGLGMEEMWLGEGELESDDGGLVVIEQPTNIVTRPLDMEDQDDRVRVVLGLTSDDPLPEADEESVGRYHSFLSGRLVFPFDATFSQEVGAFSSRTHSVTVIGLRPTAEIDDMYGLMCDARNGTEVVQVPLSDVEPKKGNPNRQLVGDYSYWFVNWA